ncbi:MAG: histidinol-phosphate aminotransferase family protein [Spirochaetia bacterium]|nr:histidinol-phosphate aminotransferase family protein [Spirochaetia bacterium]
MSLIEKIVKPEIRNLVRIQDGFDERFNYLRLDKNERLLPFNSNLMQDFLNNLKQEDIMGYSEMGPVYLQLSGYLDVAPDQILIAAGGDLAIKSVYESCIDRGDTIIYHAPSYAMFRIYGKMFGAKEKLFNLSMDLSHKITDMLNLVDDETKMVVLENPNGFIGYKPELEEIEYFAAETCKRDIILLLDEAYFYVDNKRFNKQELIQKYPNMIVTQAFSKAHGLAGMRFGYLIGNSKLINYISRVRPMHEVSSLTAKLAQWIMSNPELLEEFHRSIKDSRRFLGIELKKIGIKYMMTTANFMLLYLPNEGKTANINLKLKEKGILIRRPFDDQRLLGWSRVCIGSMDDSMRFISSLRQIILREI